MIVIIVIFSTLATVSTKVKQHAVCKEERKSYLHAVSFQIPGNLFFFGESVSCIGQTPIFYHREQIPTSIQEFVCSISDETKDHWLTDL